MKIFYCSIVLTLLSSYILSQTVEEKVANPSLDFTIQPSTYIAYHPRINIGIEYSFDRWVIGTDIEYGDHSFIQYSLSEHSQPWTPEYNYYSIRPKVLLFGNKNIVRVFTGAELVLSLVQDQFKDNYYIPREALEDDHFRVYYSKANFHRRKIALYMINGIDFSFSKSIGMRFFYGFGYAFVSNKFTELANSNKEVTDEIYESWFDFNFSILGSSGGIERSAHKFYDSRHLFSVTAGLTFWISLYKIDR